MLKAFTPKRMWEISSKEIFEIFGGDEGKRLLDSLRWKGLVKKEYLVNDKWTYEPERGVRDTRFSVGGKLPELVDGGAAWKYIKEKSYQRPELSDEILRTLVMTRIYQDPLSLFSPWGPRYKNGSPKIVEGDREITTLREINEIFWRLNTFGYRKLDFLLMPADAYGTEINTLSPGFVNDYFKYLEDCAYRELGENRVEVKSWSSIRDERRDRYEELRREIKQDFDKLVKDGEYQRAVTVAKRFSPDDPAESARRYCIERLVEGKIINELYDPIKLSLVRKEKDALDGPLKRVYIIQPELRVPWMGGGKNEC